MIRSLFFLLMKINATLWILLLGWLFIGPIVHVVVDRPPFDNPMTNNNTEEEA